MSKFSNQPKGNIMDAFKKWFLNNLIAIDQRINALFGGDPDETISSRAAKAAERNKRWGCVLCKFLHKLDPDHCKKSVERDEGDNAVDPQPK